MPRAGRSFEGGRTYHIYNWVGGGLHAFLSAPLIYRFTGCHKRRNGGR